MSNVIDFPVESILKDAKFHIGQVCPFTGHKITNVNPKYLGETPKPKKRSKR